MDDAPLLIFVTLAERDDVRSLFTANCNTPLPLGVYSWSFLPDALFDVRFNIRHAVQNAPCGDSDVRKRSRRLEATKRSRRYA